MTMHVQSVKLTARAGRESWQKAWLPAQAGIKASVPYGCLDNGCAELNHRYNDLRSYRGKFHRVLPHMSRAVLKTALVPGASMFGGAEASACVEVLAGLLWPLCTGDQGHIVVTALAACAPESVPVSGAHELRLTASRAADVNLAPVLPCSAVAEWTPRQRARSLSAALPLLPVQAAALRAHALDAGHAEGCHSAGRC